MSRPTNIQRTHAAIAIQRIREAFGETQEQFAKRLGVSLTSIARYETNWPLGKSVQQQLAGLAKETNMPLDGAMISRPKKQLLVMVYEIVDDPKGITQIHPELAKAWVTGTYAQGVIAAGYTAKIIDAPE